MKRLYLIILLGFALLVAAQAQELTVKSMAVAGNDISASQYERKDLNGQACALVKVLLASPGAVFEGNVIGDVAYKTGEYWVYLTAGTKELRIKHPQTQPLQVVFKEYGIEKVSAKTTYNLSVLLPQASQPPTQKLTINYSPATATVLIDSKFYKGSGRVEAMLPVGSHDYIIAADGYETAEGSVKLTANAPRTVNENLIASVQQSTVQQSNNVQQTMAQQTSVNQSTIQQSNNVQSSAATQSASSSSSSVSGAAVETITVNGVSFNMVRVDGGTFTMGATSEQGSDAFSDEKPAHQVTLSTYSIGETEVTQALWQAVMGSNPSDDYGDNKPVEKVSWDDCQTFISKLNQLTGMRFRLPTEAEWEYAARGGSKSRGYKYSGSNTIGDVAWYYSNCGYHTHNVKTKQPNELGLYDMSGNVWEWCQDWYGSYSSNSQTNPTGASSGSDRVHRGGCWCIQAISCRVSVRTHSTPSIRSGDLGLRLAF